MFAKACPCERHPDQRCEVAQQLLPPRGERRLRDAKIVDVRRAAYGKEAVSELADACREAIKRVDRGLQAKIEALQPEIFH